MNKIVVFTLSIVRFVAAALVLKNVEQGSGKKERKLTQWREGEQLLRILK
jgi:hypothetical protein